MDQHRTPAPASTLAPPFAVLFVPVADPEGSARQAALCLAGAARELKARGVRMVALRVRAVDLRNRRVLGAFRARGVDSLPALLSGGRAHVGWRAVCRFCEQALAAQPGRAAPRRPDPRPAEGDDAVLGADDASEALEEFFDQEMRGGATPAGRFGLGGPEGRAPPRGDRFGLEDEDSEAL